jgi:hypothetical protein
MMWLNHNLNEVLQFWMGFGIATTTLVVIEYKFGLRTFIAFLKYAIKELYKYVVSRFNLAKRRHKHYRKAKQIIRKEVM